MAETIEPTICFHRVVGSCEERRAHDRDPKGGSYRSGRNLAEIGEPEQRALESSRNPWSDNRQGVGSPTQLF